MQSKYCACKVSTLSSVLHLPRCLPFGSSSITGCLRLLASRHRQSWPRWPTGDVVMHALLRACRSRRGGALLMRAGDTGGRGGTYTESHARVTGY